MVQIADSDDDAVMSNASSSSSLRGEDGSPGEWLAVTSDSTPPDAWEEVVVTLEGTSGSSSSSSSSSSTSEDAVNDDIRGRDVHDRNVTVAAASGTRDCKGRNHSNPENLPAKTREGDLLGSALQPIILDADSNLKNDHGGEAERALRESLKLGERGWTDDAANSDISTHVPSEELEEKDKTLQQEIHVNCLDSSTRANDEGSELKSTGGAGLSSDTDKHATPGDRSHRVLVEVDSKRDVSLDPLGSFGSLGLHDDSGEVEATQVENPTTAEKEDSRESLGEKNGSLDVLVATDGSSMETVPTSDHHESIQEGTTMSDAMIIQEAEENVSSPAAKGHALLDLDLLCSLLERTQDAGDALEGQDVLLFIGGTGSGKTTSVLYSAGALFEEEDSTGFFHYNPIEFPSDDLKEFKVGPGGRSITKTICATRTQLVDGTEIVLVDTPGFSDTDGAEYDIANGLGLIRALQRSKTIRPVLVFNAQLFGDRFRSLSETLDTVNRMTGGAKGIVDFTKFRYLFTRCEGREVRLIHRKLSMFEESLSEQDGDSAKGRLQPLIQDMQRKTTPAALAFDPLDSGGRFELLDEMWRGENENCALTPSDFFPFLSLGVEEKLQGELERRFAILEYDCSCGNFQRVQENFFVLRRLSIVLPEAADTTNRALSFVASSLSRIYTTSLQRFKTIWLLDVDLRDELRDSLDAVNCEIDKLLCVPDETLSLLLASVQRQPCAATELFQDMLRSCPRIEASLSSNDIHAVRKTLFLLHEVAKGMGEYPRGKAFSMAFLQAFDRTIAHVTSGFQDVELWLAANTIEELVKIESPISFAVDLLSFLNAEDIAEAEGRDVLDRNLNELLNAIQSRMDYSSEQVSALTCCLKSSLAEGSEIGRGTIAEVAKVSESRTFLIALSRMTDVRFLSSINVDPSLVSGLDALVIRVLSGVPKLAFKMIGKLERLLAESVAFNFEDERKPLLLCTEAVSGALTLCREIEQWPCIDVPGHTWEHLTSAKGSLRASLEELDECAKLIERGFAEALEKATELSQSLAIEDADASAAYIELFDHWATWESLLVAVNKSKSWFSSIKGFFGKNSSKQNPLDVILNKILRQLHHLLKGSVHRLLAMRDSEPILLLQECPKDVCFFIAFIRTPKRLSLGPQVLNSSWDSRAWLRPSVASALRKIIESIDKLNRLPSYLLSDHKYDRLDLFLRRLEETQGWVSAFRSLASRIDYSTCIINAFATEYELETLNKSLFEVPTSESVLEDVEKAVNELYSKVEQLSLFRALRLTADHERVTFFQGVANLLSACSTVETVAGHLKTEPNVATSLYQTLLQQIDSDLLAFRDGLQSITASFPDDQTSFAQIHCHLSSLSSFEQCFADVKPRLANLACRTLSECRSAVFLSLEQRVLTQLKSDCDLFADYLVVLKKASREVPFWKTDIDSFIDKTLNNRVAYSEQPESFLLDISLALRHIDGDDAVVAEQLLWDHRKFQGVLTSIFSEATAGQDITYVLNGLTLSPKQRQKLERLYSSFLELYTNKVLDGVSAFRSRNHSLDDFVFSLVTEALMTAREASIGMSESTLQLSSSLFAYWSLSNLSDLVLLENQSSSLSKYVMRPHAAQVVASWIMLNVHDSDDFHALKHHLIELGTGEGKSIILGVVATILAVWGYSVDVLCYSSYLSRRDFTSFQKMFSDFGVSGWIWYGTLRGLSPRIIGSRYFDSAEAAIEDSAVTNCQRVPFRPSVLLVDEVDVFFGADVFGTKSRQCCTFSPNSFVSLLKVIWQRSGTQESSTSILNIPEVQQCLSELPAVLHQYFNRTIGHMQSDAVVVRRNAGLQYHVIEDQIAYKYFDGVDTNVYYGYVTHFHYIKEWENGNISTASMESKVEGLLYDVALTSYAEYPFAFDVTLGITGTLRALMSDERRVLEDMYGIRSYSYIPSVFGRNKLVFAGDKETDFKLCDTHGDQVFELKHELVSRRESVVESHKVLRPVMIFFDRKDALLKFHSSTLMESLKDQVAVVTEATPTYEKDSLFLKATEAGAITLMLREFGRGTDFKCFDRRVLEAGGVHVIQAFFSKELSEEIQIKGRCARQGAAGSYSMVLNVEDLKRDFDISKPDTEAMRSRRELYSYVNEKRKTTHTSDLTKRKERVAAAEEVHYRTLSCKEALESGFEEASQRFEIVSYFNELNGLGESRSFTHTGLKESTIAKRASRFKAYKVDDRKKRSEARVSKRFETRERLKPETASHYSVLGVDHDASAEDVKHAFLVLSTLFHPDNCKDDDAAEIFHKLREARDVLSCDEKREAYDKELVSSVPTPAADLSTTSTDVQT